MILPLLQRTKSPFYKVVLGFIPFIILLLVISHFVTPNKFVGLYFASAMLIIIAIFFALGNF